MIVEQQRKAFPPNACYTRNASFCDDIYKIFGTKFISEVDASRRSSTAISASVDRDGRSLYHSDRIDISSPSVLDYSSGMILMTVKLQAGQSPTATGRIIRDSSSENNFVVYRNSSDTSLAFTIGATGATFSVTPNLFDGELHSLVLGWDNGSNRWLCIDGYVYTSATAHTPASMSSTWYLNGNATSTAKAMLKYYCLGFKGMWNRAIAERFMASPGSIVFQNEKSSALNVASGSIINQLMKNNVGADLFNGTLL